MNNRYRIIAAVFSVAALAMTGCHKDTGVAPKSLPGGSPAIISVSSAHSALSTTATTTVSCQANDPDDDSLAYFWSAIYGSFPDGNEGASIRWQAPTAPCASVITCTVTDFYYSVSSSLSIVVYPATISWAYGTVYRQAGGVAVAATVCFGTECDLTDIDGQYSVWGISPGSTEVTITGAGPTFRDTLDLIPGVNQFDFTL